MKLAMNQMLVYWERTAENDVYGAPTYAGPVQMQCRWEDKSEVKIDKAGLEFVSQARVYVPMALHLDGYICKGTLAGLHADTHPTANGGLPIKAVAEIPAVRGAQVLRMVWL